MNNLEPKTFYFNLPLYTVINISDDNQDEFVELMDYNETVNEYNPNLRENTTYRIRTLVDLKSRVPRLLEGQTYGIIYDNHGRFDYSVITCLRTNEVFYVFYYFDLEKRELMKIGQYPSIADLHISQIKSYDKVLSPKKLKEFTRAIGLAANGVGIGSFVYLRRIFEGLIDEAYTIAMKENSLDVSNYNDIRMDEKIVLLKGYLPEFLFENRALYGILSTGIHELAEQECLAYFDIVKSGIELILDEKLEKYIKKKKIEEAKKKINFATSQINKND